MLSGYKTYITGGLAVILGVAELLGFTPPGITVDPATLLTTGFGMIFLRSGINTAVASAGK